MNLSNTEGGAVPPAVLGVAPSVRDCEPPQYWGCEPPRMGAVPPPILGSSPPAHPSFWMAPGFVLTGWTQSCFPIGSAKAGVNDRAVTAKITFKLRIVYLIKYIFKL